jgi:histidinol-phosphatase (PHP family)
MFLIKCGGNIMFDCHIHSDFSSDGRMTAEAACERAAALGLHGLAFTDHLDIEYPDTNENFNIDFDCYMEFMRNIRNQYKHQLKVAVGIEVGIQPHVIEQTQKIVWAHEFDYVLASVHIIDGIDPYLKEYYKDKTRIEAYERYIKEILYMVRNFPDFDNVGHIEYITRYADYDDRSLRYKDHSDLFDELLRELIDMGKGFEVNTGSFRDKPGIRTCEYDIAVLKRYRELGGEIASLGSDAHNTEYIGYKFDVFKDILIEAGFSHAVYFEKRKPVFYRL